MPGAGRTRPRTPCPTAVGLGTHTRARGVGKQRGRGLVHEVELGQQLPLRSEIGATSTKIAAATRSHPTSTSRPPPHSWPRTRPPNVAPAQVPHSTWSGSLPARAKEQETQHGFQHHILLLPLLLLWLRFVGKCSSASKITMPLLHHFSHVRRATRKHVRDGKAHTTWCHRGRSSL